MVFPFVQKSVGLLLTLVTWLGISGCVTSEGTSEKSLPADWKSGLPRAGAADIAGVYVEQGEQLDARFSRDGTVGRANLSTFISPDIPSRKIAQQAADRGASTELRRADANHLELITRIGEEVTGRMLFAYEDDLAAGTVVLHRSKSSADLYAVGNVSLTLQLWRAADGRLYVHAIGDFTGGVMLMPTLSSKEVWCRWDPATPEGLLRQAAAADALAAERARVIALNAARPKVGQTAPAIEGPEALSGRLIRMADYEGKVLVLYVWSTSKAARMHKPVRDIYGKYRDRGVEVVGLCTNAANEKETVSEFLRATPLAGAQLYDGAGVQGKVYESYFGAGRGYYCVVDRRGRVAAYVVLPGKLEEAVEKVLASP